MRPIVSAFLYFGIVLFSFAPCVAQTPAATLEIQMPESKFALGTPIRLDVTIKNISTERLHIWKVSPQDDGRAEAYMSVEVLDSEGKSLPRIDGVTFVHDGKKDMMPKSWTRKGVTVKANQELHDFLLLSNLFDLSKPGMYTVSVKTDIPKPNPGSQIKFVVVASNSINFAVKQ